RRPPAPVRRAPRRGGGGGAGGVAGGGLSELEVRPGLAPRRPRKIIPNPRDTFPLDGALTAEPLPEGNRGHRRRTRQIPLPGRLGPGPGRACRLPGARVCRRRRAARPRRGLAPGQRRRTAAVRPLTPYPSPPGGEG